MIAAIMLPPLFYILIIAPRNIKILKIRNNFVIAATEMIAVFGRVYQGC